MRRPSRLQVLIFCTLMLTSATVWACHNAWSPTICGYGNYNCLWTQELEGDIDHEPDVTAQTQTCLASGGVAGTVTWIVAQWLYTCCCVPDGGFEPEGPPEN